MKLSTSLIALVVIVLVGVFWLALTTQDVVAPEEPVVENSDEVVEDSQDNESDADTIDVEVDFEGGTDVGMEMPIPDMPGVPEMVVDEVASQIFEVGGSNFAFDVSEIRVKEGDTVTINFTSVSGFHDWVVDEFNAATDKVNTGGKTSVTFVADKAGTYEYYCSVGSHRANGMVGTLIVE